MTDFPAPKLPTEDEVFLRKLDNIYSVQSHRLVLRFLILQMREKGFVPDYAALEESLVPAKLHLREDKPIRDNDWRAM